MKIVNFVHIDTTWYEFSYFHPNICTATIYEFQKNQIREPNGYVKNQILTRKQDYNSFHHILIL